MDINTMISNYNKPVIDAASEVLAKERGRLKPWVDRDVLNLCVKRRDWMKRRYEAERAKENRKAK